MWRQLVLHRSISLPTESHLNAVLCLTSSVLRKIWLCCFCPSFPPPPLNPSANTYYFMVQARGIMLRDNVRTIGQILRSYTNKNSTLNGTGERKYTPSPPNHPNGFGIKLNSVLNSILALSVLIYQMICLIKLSPCAWLCSQIIQMGTTPANILLNRLHTFLRISPMPRTFPALNAYLLWVSFYSPRA